MSTSKRLDEIEARANAATPGPWKAHTRGPDEFVPAALPWEISGRILRAEGVTSVPLIPHGEQDAAFIAEARADVPWLCEKLREAVALLAQTAHGDWDHTGDYDTWIARRKALLAALDEDGKER